PDEVLSEFSDRIGHIYANDELMPRMTRALAEGTGASRVDLWIRIGDELRAEATWPGDADPPSPLAASDNAEGAVSSTSMLEPIRHQGEFLGALSIEERAGEANTATAEEHSTY